MKKLRTVFFGITHEHAVGKLISIKLIPDVYDVVGVVVDEDNFKLNPSSAKDWVMGEFKPYPVLTMEQAFAMKDIDVAFVEVTNAHLVEIATQCAEHGLPMHMDKPGGESLKDYVKLLNYCRDNRIPLQMGYVFRKNPALDFARNLMKSGVLGKVFEIRMDMNHGYGSKEYGEYLASFKGGIMYNLGCHMVDYILTLFDDKEPEQIIPVLGTVAGYPDNVKNNCMAILKYPSTNVFLQSCGDLFADTGLTARRTLLMNGTNGWLELSPVEVFGDTKFDLTFSIKDDTPNYPSGTYKVQLKSRQDRYVDQLKELAQVVAGEIKDPITYDHDILVHKVTLLASGYELDC